MAPATRADRIRAARRSLEAETARDYEEGPEDEERPTLPAYRNLSAARTEAREMMHQLDEIERALATARSAGPARSVAPSLVAPESEAAETGPVCDPRGRHGRAIFGEPSPYLEERMGGARTAAADLAQALDEIAERSGRLRVTVASLAEELNQASREIQFLRSEDTSSAPVPLPTSPVRAREEAATRERARARSVPATPSAPETAAPFAEYTTERYNRSVGVLANQREKIGTTMLVLAAVISAALLVITYLSHEPTPSAFVAGLPVIWMIPVPFFVVSFRGTQRVLRTTPMHLEGGF